MGRAADSTGLIMCESQQLDWSSQGPARLSDCCATGVYADIENNENESYFISALTVATCHLDLKKKQCICVEIYSCHGSARDRELDADAWQLCATAKITPMKYTRIALDTTIVVPPRSTCGLHVFAGRHRESYVCCTMEDTLSQGPITVHAGCSASTKTTLFGSEPFGISSAMHCVRKDRVFRGGIEFISEWARTSLLWLAQRDAENPLSKVPPVLMGYILHLAKINPHTHDSAACEMCCFFDVSSRLCMQDTVAGRPCTLGYAAAEYKAKLRLAGRIAWPMRR